MRASIAAAAAGLGCAAYLWRRAERREIARLAEMLGWRPGASVADVGAGSGKLALVAARFVGPTGHVFATEIEPRKLRKMQRQTSRRSLTNVSVIAADGGSTGLAPDSCDAILLRGSYHHFTHPAAIAEDLYRALRPSGVVVIVDFPPRRWLSIVAPVHGVPSDRGGHGIPMDVLIPELMQAGFQVREIVPRWFLDVYCVVFCKPPVAS